MKGTMYVAGDVSMLRVSPQNSALAVNYRSRPMCHPVANSQNMHRGSLNDRNRQRERPNTTPSGEIVIDAAMAIAVTIPTYLQGQAISSAAAKQCSRAWPGT